MKVESFITLENSLTKLLLDGWRDIAKSLLPKVFSLASHGHLEEAIKLANGIDLAPIVAENMQKIRFLSYSAMIFGASRITPDPKDTVIAEGGHDEVVDKAIALFATAIANNVEDAIRTTLLDQINQIDKDNPTSPFANSDLVQKFNPYHGDDGRFASAAGSQEGDLAKQVEWFNAKAKGFGYQDADELEKKNPEAFTALAEEWRKTHAVKYSPDQPRDEHGRWSDGTFTESLGIERSGMPQIMAKDMEEFAAFAALKGVKITPETVAAADLKPAQKHYNPLQVEQMKPEALVKPITISADNYVLDGTNRWVRNKQDDPKRMLKVNRIHLPALEALALMHSFPKSFSKGIEQIGATAKKYSPDEPRDERGRWTTEGATLTYDKNSKQWTGANLSEADKARLKALKVPPMWNSVRLNPDPTAAMQAIGKDAKGRTQYRYSAEHSEKAAASKFERLKEFNAIVSKVQATAQRDMQRKDLTPEQRDAAAVVHLINLTGFRIGSDADTLTRHTAYGASTLNSNHVKIDGDKMVFSFTGKKGVRINKTVTDGALASYIAGKGLGDKARIFNTSDSLVRDYFHGIAGSDFKVKDLRTWHGTAIALGAISKLRMPRNDKEYTKQRNYVGDKVAKFLGNTRAVALSAYIDPAVFKKWGPAPPPKVRVTKWEKGVMDEFFATHSYDDYGNWHTVPATDFDPDEDPDIVVAEFDALKVMKAPSILQPFVSFSQDVQDEATANLQLTASLHASRLSAYGFTAEADATDTKMYTISEQLDNRICPICMIAHGKRFPVEAARNALRDILNADNPDDLATMQPWPDQSKRGVEEFASLSNEELIARNWHIPPYHPNCRGLLVMPGDEQNIVETPSAQAALDELTQEGVDIPPELLAGLAAQAARTAIVGSITGADLFLIRQEIEGLSGQAAIDAWVNLTNTYDVADLEELFGVTNEDVLAGNVDFTQIDFSALDSLLN